MNPFEARPDKIPADDRYSDIPFYGRYHPQPDDFHPEPQFCLPFSCRSPDALAYWSEVLQKCNSAVRIYENDLYGRDVFAMGSVIVKSSHLHTDTKSTRDYSYADENEVAATSLARDELPSNVKVPRIYFAGKINGHQVLVQERIPGVGLNVAWQYLSSLQKDDFKQQARHLLQALAKVQPPPTTQGPSYVVTDSDPMTHKGIRELEEKLLFHDDTKDYSSYHRFCLMHNDFTRSNCIVNAGQIVGLVDWEMAGFFGWKRAALVHAQVRSPQRESYAALNLPEEMMADMMFWNDLYL